MTFYIAQCRLDNSDHPMNHWLNSMFEDENGVIEFDTEGDAVQAIDEKMKQYENHWPDAVFRVIRYEPSITQVFYNQSMIEFYHEDN